MAETSAAVRGNDTGVRWWEPLVAFVGGNAVAIALTSGTLLVAIARGLPAKDAIALVASFTGIMASVILGNLVVLAVAWGLVRWRMASPLAAYFSVVPVRVAVLAAAVGVALSVLVNGGNHLIDAAGWIPFSDTAMERAMVPHTVMQFAVSLFAVTLLAPLVEEFIFRGLLMHWLLRYMGVGGAVSISSVVFALVHAQFTQHPNAQGVLLTVQLALLGAVLGLLVARTGSLRTSFAVHAAFNLTSTILSVIGS